MKHKKAGILRRNIRNILGDYQHCLYVRYVQEYRVKMLVTRHQEQAGIKSITSVGQSVVNEYSIAGMQARLNGSSEKQHQMRNAYCAHHELPRTLRPGNPGRSVTIFYTQKRSEFKAAFPFVFTPKRQAKFDL